MVSTRSDASHYRGRGRYLARTALAVMMAGGGAGALASAPPTVQVSPVVVTASPDRFEPVSYPDGVRSYLSIPYAQPPGFRPLTLDLYLPPDPAGVRRGPFPLVMFVHGGAWMGGDPRKLGALTDFPQLLARLAARGYVVASISYRLSGEARFPAAAIDVRAALLWLRGQPRYRIDRGRAVVWGASAGGQLAALTATACTNSAFDAVATVDRNVDACVQGVVSWYGIFDFGTIAAQARTSRLPGAARHDGVDAPEWRMLGCAPAHCGTRIALASPVTHVSPRTPPMLLIAGTDDRTVPAQQSIEMAARLRQAGVENELLLLPGVDHSFIGANAEATRDATQRAVDATFGFIDRILGASSRR
jgi:acetyl esterase/lipase